MASQDDLSLLKQMHGRGEISDDQYDVLRRHVLWGTPLPALLDEVPPPPADEYSPSAYLPPAAPPPRPTDRDPSTGSAPREDRLPSYGSPPAARAPSAGRDGYGSQPAPAGGSSDPDPYRDRLAPPGEPAAGGDRLAPRGAVSEPGSRRARREAAEAAESAAPPPPAPGGPHPSGRRRASEPPAPDTYGRPAPAETTGYLPPTEGYLPPASRGPVRPVGPSGYGPPPGRPPAHRPPPAPDEPGHRPPPASHDDGYGPSPSRYAPSAYGPPPVGDAGPGYVPSGLGTPPAGDAQPGYVPSGLGTPPAGDAGPGYVPSGFGAPPGGDGGPGYVPAGFGAERGVDPLDEPVDGEPSGRRARRAAEKEGGRRDKAGRRSGRDRDTDTAPAESSRRRGDADRADGGRDSRPAGATVVGAKKKPRRRSVFAVLTSLVLALALTAAGVYWFVLRDPAVKPADYAQSICGSVRDWQTAVDSGNSTLVSQVAREDDKTVVRGAVQTYYSGLAVRTDQLRVAILDAGVADVSGGRAYADSLAAAVGDQATALRDLATRAGRLDPAASATFTIQLQSLLTGSETAVSAVGAALARPSAGTPVILRTALAAEPACAPYVG